METKFEQLYLTRIQQFITRLENLLYAAKRPFQIKFSHYENREPLAFSERPQNYQAIQQGKAWGSNWQRAWFHLSGRVPEHWQDQHVVALVDLGGEGLVYNASEQPINAISVHSIWADEFKRNRLHVSEQARGNEFVEFWIDATAAQLFGLKENHETEIRPLRHGDHTAVVGECCLAIFRQDIWHLMLDTKILQDLLISLPAQSVRRARILRAINAAIDIFQPDKNVDECRNILKIELAKPTSASTLSTTATGHAHIDTAWLWPLDETYRKCARTFAAQLANIEKYPNYIFGASQAQHYAFVKKFYPELYERIKAQIAAGRWEVQGGMWVEADCNISSGESLIRQILFGKRFFRKEFGIDVKNLWLPDVFGYSAALPQILVKSGIDFFITQKLSWSQFNKFPHHTFQWRGIDGTEILTHFPPEDNYNSELAPSKLIYAQDNFKEKAVLDEFLTLFGIGDGGGGPTEEHIEKGMRQQNLEGAPRVCFDSAQNFMNRLAEHKEQLPTWVGELYLELHRGTLTTQAYNKKMNRRLEKRLRELEILYTCMDFENYPLQTFDDMWTCLLKNQFHDIIPGSSIPEVYEDSKKDYEKLTEQADVLQQSIGDRLHADAEHLVLYNSLSCAWKGAIELPPSWHKFNISCNGHPVPVQVEADQTSAWVKVPLLSSISLKKEKKEAQQPVEQHSLVLENDLIRYTFAQDATLVDIYDKTIQQHVLVKNTCGNMLSLYEDRPANWDAWDIDIYYENQKLEQARCVSHQRIADGPVRQGIHFSLKIGQSTIEQKIYLAAHSKRLDFVTRVTWMELHKMLRVAFQTPIKTNQATFEIQYGHVERPTHRNTSWDMARFEVAAHRWADLSDHDYGFALLNDCKYGYKIFDGTLDLNLLRSPSSPNPNADQGEHEFTYSLLPHIGNLLASDVIAEAEMLNQPPVQLAGVHGKISLPFSLQSNGVILETVKKAQDENALILRFYEPFGKEGKCKIQIKNISAAWNCDLLENSLAALEIKNGEINLSFKAFEIKTIKIL